MLRELDAGAHGAAAKGGWQLSPTVMEPDYVWQGLRPLGKEQRSGKQPVTLTATEEIHIERPVASTTGEVALQE